MSINFFYENLTTSFKEYIVKSSFSNLSLIFLIFIFLKNQVHCKSALHIPPFLNQNYVQFEEIDILILIN